MARLYVNPPCPVYFAGFKSTTYELGQRGWDISFEDSVDHRLSCRLLLYHAASNLKAFGECNDFSLADFRYSPNHGRLPEFHIKNAFSNYCMQERNFAFHEWSETRPAFIDVPMKDIMSFPLFMSKQRTSTQEIIVEPQEVADILESIMRMQSPAQAEIRKKNRQHATPIACATILSLAA